MEFEDKNLKAAVKKAAKVLKVPAESLKYEVISYGSTGIFGLVGAKKAKIRVDTSKKEKGESGSKPIQGDAPKGKKAVKKMPGKPQAKPPTKPQAKPQAKPLENPPEKPSEKPPGPPPEQPIEKAVERPVEAAPSVDQKISIDTSEAAEAGRTVIQKIIDKITDGATVQVESKEESVVFHVDGGKTALIIGKRGQTLEAIQYLVDRIVNKDREKRIRFQIDVAGYLESKKANLEQRALHLADKVKKTGKPVTVGELNVYDRKIVHMCLKEDRDVRTQSMGSGFYRKLVIFPTKANGQKKKNQIEG